MEIYFYFISLFWLWLTSLFFLSAGCTYTSINTRQHQVIFRYAEWQRSEKDLPMCEKTSVCSVLHKRYWLPDVAERLCRCNSNEECPWKWTSIPDNYTMTLNNRSQLKFCSEIINQSKCNSKKVALVTEKQTGSNLLFNVNVNCFCPFNHYWKRFKTNRVLDNVNKTQIKKEEFKCVPLKRCTNMEFCGNVRTDFNSIYYVCSCPTEHFCVYKNKKEVIVDLLLYKGPVYKAFCVPTESSDYDY